MTWLRTYKGFRKSSRRNYDDPGLPKYQFKYKNRWYELVIYYPYISIDIYRLKFDKDKKKILQTLQFAGIKHGDHPVSDALIKNIIQMARKQLKTKHNVHSKPYGGAKLYWVVVSLKSNAGLLRAVVVFIKKNQGKIYRYIAFGFFNDAREGDRASIQDHSELAKDNQIYVAY